MYSLGFFQPWLQEPRCFFDPSPRINAILRPPCGVHWTPERKAFSYHKRTMDRAMGAFLAVVAVPRINKLGVINTLNSSTPVASTTNSFIINCLLTDFNFRTIVFCGGGSPPGFSHDFSFSLFFLPHGHEFNVLLRAPKARALAGFLPAQPHFLDYWYNPFTGLDS
jgi:hypothetical protein